jgi:hypothetical protein
MPTTLETDLPYLHLTGPNGAAFRAGWLEGKERVNTGNPTAWPKGSIGSAASAAAVAFHKELRK